MGVPLVIIRFRLGFSNINLPPFMETSKFNGHLQIYSSKQKKHQISGKYVNLISQPGRLGVVISTGCKFNMV